MLGRTLRYALGLIASACIAQFAAAASPPAHAGHASTHAHAATAQGDQLGSWHRAISSKSPEAQKAFDRGLRLKYAFNVEAAQKAFEAAVTADSNCAICHWGVALTQSHDINLPAIPDREAGAYAAVQKARAHEADASPVERALIEALAKRCSATPAADPAAQAALDQAYVDAMREATKQFPGDLDVATLFAESMMELHPWNWWTHERTPEPGTPEIIATLESVLKRNPMHPGANHYYIHALEESDHPEKAVRSAERLLNMAPAAGHLVHMPGHIFELLGRYADAAQANRRAIAADRAYFAKVGQGSPIYTVYLAHNCDFLALASMMQGRSAEAIEAARGAASSAPLDMLRMMPGMDFFLTPPYFAMTRFGKWDEILKEPAPPVGFPYVTAIWHFSRGVALCAKGRPDDAAAERDSVAAVAAATPEAALEGFSPERTILAVATHWLEGELAAKRGNTEQAIHHFEEAVKAEDSLHYDEPPDWLIPARHVLGAQLLSAGQAAEAEAVYRADLAKHPENGWALLGLSQSLRAQKKDAEPAAMDARFKKAWANADVTLEASSY